jgi:hypothetical protein
LHPGVDHVRLLGDDAAHAPGRGALPPGLHFRGRDPARDLLVLGGDRTHVVELVEHVVEVPGLQQDVDGRRLVLLVDVDETQVEPLDGERVLALQVAEADRLQAEELVQLGEPGLVEREIRAQ